MVEAGGIGAHPLGEKPLSIAPLRMFTSRCALCVTFHAPASSCVILLLALLLTHPKHGSPCLFNSYAEYIMRNAGLHEAQAGIKIVGRNTNKLRNADDTTLRAESRGELKSLLRKLKEESGKSSLKTQLSEN